MAKLNLPEELINLGKKFSPTLWWIYDFAKEKKNQYDNSYEYDKYKFRENFKKDAQHRADLKKTEQSNKLVDDINYYRWKLDKDLTWWSVSIIDWIWPDADQRQRYLDLINSKQNELKDLNKDAAIKAAQDRINDYQWYIDALENKHWWHQSDLSPNARSIAKYNDMIKEQQDFIDLVQWTYPVNNMDLNKYFPDSVNFDKNNQAMKKGDRQWTINDIMEKMELMVQHDDYMRSQNKNYKAPKSEDEEFNNYKKQLKNLWVSFDDFRWWYYGRHPTPEIEAWDKAWEKLNESFYNMMWWSSAQNNNSSNKTVNNKWVKFNPRERKYRFTKPDNRIIL